MTLLTKLVKHELVSGSFFIFAGSMFSNILAFLLNLFLARNLSYTDYAIFASLLSVITLAFIPAGSINTIIVKFAADYFIKNEESKLKSLYVLSFKFILGFSVTAILLFTFLSIPISKYLHVDNILYVILTGFVIAAFYLNTLNSAFLQSLMKFKFMSVAGGFGGIIKLVMGIALVTLGYKAFGGLWALFFMAIGTYLICFVPLRHFLTKKADKISIHSTGLLAYAVPTFVTILFLTSFTSTDVILVKHFFDPHLAGYYSGLSLIGKVIFYFTAPIPIVMFPLLVKRHAKGRTFNNLFYLSLILVLLPSIGITFFYFIFPNFVINLFLGGREYLYVAPYLGMFGIYLTVFSLVNVCVNFFLSLNKTDISVWVVIAAISQIVFIYLFHSTFYEVIGVSLVILSVLLAILFYSFIRNFGNFEKVKNSTAFLSNSSI